MEFLSQLWLPILLSAVFVFIVSTVLHMLIPIHKSDFKQVPGEEKVLAEMRAQNIAPGDYMFPWAGSMKDACTPEMIEKQNRGPVGLLTVRPNGQWKMGPGLTQWFLYLLLVSIFTGYAAFYSLDPGESYLEVFRIAGSIAVLAYATSNIPNSIWKGTPWSTTFKFMFDGIIYGLVTAGTFGWLWPGAAS